MSKEKEIAQLREVVKQQNTEIRRDFPKVANTANKVFEVAGFKPTGNQYGAAFVHQGKLITALHSVKDCDLFILTHVNGESEDLFQLGKPDYTYPDLDLATFSLEGTGVDNSFSVPFVDKYQPSDGFCFIIGFPRILFGAERGEISMEPIIHPAFFQKNSGYQFSTLVERSYIQNFEGFSGGMAVNMAGEVLGMTHHLSLITPIDGPRIVLGVPAEAIHANVNFLPQQ